MEEGIWEGNLRLRLGVVGVGVGLGLLGNSLLRITPAGLNVVLWVAALALAFLGLTRWQRMSLERGACVMLLGAVLFAATFLWRDSAALRWLNLLCLLITLGLASTMQAGRLTEAGMVAYGAALLRSASGTIGGFLVLVGHEIPWRELLPSRASTRSAAILRGLLFALPLLVVFGALFRSADAVFASVIGDLLDWNIITLATDLFWSVFWCWLAAGLLRQMLNLHQQPDIPRGPLAPVRLGWIELVIVLGLLDALFLAFVLVQLRYFFGGASTVTMSDDLTYAMYARQGFFELVIVAALVLPLLLLFDWMRERDAQAGERGFRALAGALVALLFVIMASAAQRMNLYQRAFGLTEQRLYASAFMAWLALVLIWFLRTVLRGRRERFALGALLAGFLCVLLLNALNPDNLIVHTNLTRTLGGAPLDADYVTRLSADAVPALVQALPKAGVSERCRIAERLLATWLPTETQDWRNWNASRVRAYERVRVLGADLEREAQACYATR